MSSLLKCIGDFSLIALLRRMFLVVVAFLITTMVQGAELTIFAVSEAKLGRVNVPVCSVKRAINCATTLQNAFVLIQTIDWQKKLIGNYSTVRLKIIAGRYRLTSPILLQWNIKSVRLDIGGAGVSTVLSGARPLKDWHHLSHDDYSTQIKPNVIHYLYVTNILSKVQLPPPSPHGFGLPITPLPIALFNGDVALPLAHWPNSGYGKLEQPIDVNVNDSRTFRIVGRSGLDWYAQTDVMFHAFWGNDWADQSYFADVGRDGWLVLRGTGAIYGIKSGQRIRVENALSELDSLGEWYLDRSSGQLIAWLPKRKGVYEISDAEGALLIKSAHNITIHDLVIEKVRGDAVVVQNSDNVVFDRVNIRHTGNRALTIQGGTRCGIRNALLEHMGEGGVVLEGGDRQSLLPSGHFVERSTIRDFNRWTKTYRPAIEMKGVGQHVVGNIISDAPHLAILVFGNDHEIANNEFFNLVRETSDAGAIYTGRDLTAYGTEIRDNFFHDISPNDSSHEVKGIYLDDQASGFTISNNIFARVQQPVFIGGGRDNAIVNNVFYQSSPAIYLDGRGLTWQRAMTLDSNGVFQQRLNDVPYRKVLWAKRYPRLANVLNDQLGVPKYNKACGNVVVKGQPYFVKSDVPLEKGLNELLEGISVKSEATFVSPLLRRGRRYKDDFTLKQKSSTPCFL